MSGSCHYGKVQTENKVDNESRMGMLIGHNAGTFDGTGVTGSYGYNSGSDTKYLFKSYEGRVGKQG